MLIAERFKSERERLDLTQPEVAVLAQVGKTTVINWEKSASSPTAVQLEALARVGFDSLYVITGQRTGGVKPAPTLTADEEELLALFRAAPLAVKAAAIGALHGAAAAPGAAKPRAKAQPRSAPAKASPEGSVTQTNHGGLNIAVDGHVVQGDVINGVPAAGKTARGRKGAS